MICFLQFYIDFIDFLKIKKSQNIFLLKFIFGKIENNGKIFIDSNNSNKTTQDKKIYIESDKQLL